MHGITQQHGVLQTTSGETTETSQVFVSPAVTLDGVLLHLSYRLSHIQLTKQHFTNNWFLLYIEQKWARQWSGGDQSTTWAFFFRLNSDGVLSVYYIKDAPKYPLARETYGVVPKGLLTFRGSLYKEGAKTTSKTLVYRFERQTARIFLFLPKTLCPHLRT